MSSGNDERGVEASDRGYSLRGRRVEYVTPTVRRGLNRRARSAAGVPGNRANGDDGSSGVRVVDESPPLDNVNKYE